MNLLPWTLSLVMGLVGCASVNSENRQPSAEDKSGQVNNRLLEQPEIPGLFASRFTPEERRLEIAQSAVPAIFIMEARNAYPNLTYDEQKKMAAKKFLAEGGEFIAEGDALKKIIEEVVFDRSAFDLYKTQAIYVAVSTDSSIEIRVTNSGTSQFTSASIIVRSLIEEDQKVLEAKAQTAMEELNLASLNDGDVKDANERVFIETSGLNVKALRKDIFIRVDSNSTSATKRLGAMLRNYVAKIRKFKK